MAPNELSQILDYLDSTGRKLLAEIEAADLNLQPADGGWSAGQVFAHLIRTEKYFYPLFAFVPRVFPSQVFLEPLNQINVWLCKLAGMKFFGQGEPPQGVGALDAKLKARFAAPAFLKPRRRYFELNSLLAEREKTRRRTLDAVTKADFSKLKELRFSHPVLGSFTLLEFVVFLGKHEEWHTEQIKRIRARADSDA